MSPLIEARAIGYRAGGKPLVEEVSFALHPGRVLAVIGPNGAGKSTLLRLLTGELRPCAGTVLYDGAPLRLLPGWRLACKRAVMSQSALLSFPFEAHEVVRVGLDGVGRGLAAARQSALIADCMAAADVAHLAPRLYQTLSGGEQQRVQFARALAQLRAGATLEKRQVLFLDEPIANLDLRHQFAVLAAARQIAASGVGVFAVLHDLTLAASYADELMVLDGGRIVAAGAPEAVLTERLLSQVFRVDLSREPARTCLAPLIRAQRPAGLSALCP
ncbi:iron complex transport system ATP-binding protein [Rhizobiales bacterium GAS188]|nr:iron complex transport system ATP-binding protein [Rhizobiales bacterium GAS188]